jgi:hypothetical protein
MLNRFLPTFLLLIASCTYDYAGLQKIAPSDGSSEGGLDAKNDVGASGDTVGGVDGMDTVAWDMPGVDMPVTDTAPGDTGASDVPGSDKGTDTTPDTAPPTMWAPSGSVTCDPSWDSVSTCSKIDGSVATCASRVYMTIASGETERTVYLETKCVKVWFAGAWGASCTKPTPTSLIPSDCNPGLACLSYPYPDGKATAPACATLCRCIDGPNTCPEKDALGRPQVCYVFSGPGDPKNGQCVVGVSTANAGIGVCGVKV